MVFVLAAALLPFLAPDSFAQVPTIEKSLSLKNVFVPRISPDGRYVAYQVQETNWEDNAFENEIWIAVVGTGEKYQLTNAKKSSSNPRWSPDSRHIAFVSDREGKNQLYLISPAGGEAVALTRFEGGVTSFEWSPDGRRIAITARDAESKAGKERKEKYGEFEVVNGDYTMTHLWMIEVPSDAVEKPPEPLRLTEGDAFTVGGFDWSPDSTRIAFSAARTPDLSASDTTDLYVLNVSSRSVKKIVDTRGPDVNPVWSPDGREIAYQTAAGREFFYYLNSQIAIVPPEGGTPRILSGSFDESPQLIEWAPEGIYFSSQQKTSSHLFRLDPSTRAIERISSPDTLIS
jgi:Tol biopolymer transport system component